MMEYKEIVMIVAVIAGPILAVQAQKYLESLKESRARKLRIFHTLMSTRATRVAPDHVAALNMIDIEFYGKQRFGRRSQSEGERKITNAWKVYNDHLNTKKMMNNLTHGLIKVTTCLPLCYMRCRNILVMNLTKCSLKEIAIDP